MKNKKRKFKGRELNATFTFNKKVAKSFHNTDYYKSQSDFNKSIVDIDDAKRAMATSNQAVVNEIFAKYIEKAKNEEINSFRVITNIRDKVIRHIQEGKELPKHDDLLSLVSNKYVLLQAYKNTRGNKGVLSQGYPMPRGEMEKLNAEQKILAEKLYELPDGLNWKQIEWISDLVKTGKYPWGYSKLIFIPKPGTTKMRPLTIPPYADRMVQEAIRIVLEPIYEPVFRKMNVSFGFHSGVGVHNAITLTSEGRKTNGLTYAIEGDIEQAYPSLDRDKLVEILSHRIKDIKFLKFIRKRLNLKLFNTETKKYENTTRGIPQGGVDSPYLWNIYLLGMDQQVIKLCQEIAEKHNNKRLINIGRGSNKNKILNPPVNKDHNKINRLIIKNKKNIGNIYNSGDPEDVKKAKIHHIQRQTKQFLHIRRNIPFTDQNRKEVRFFYARYADDFIILTNAPKDGRLELKTSLTKWLKEELSLTLSDEKTKLTDISKESAHFLGFELMNKNTRRISRDKNGVLKRTAGWQITIGPDKQRLINRMFMKGYCDKDGFPREIPWLSTLDAYTIISRYNAVLRGLANYYAEYINYPSSLYRWLYIVRWSALKTLACKHHTKISKVKETYPNLTTKVSVTLQNGKQYFKQNKLLTEKEAIQAGLALNLKKQISKDQLEREKTGILLYEAKNNKAKLLNSNFLEQITWVNMRTQVNLALPCLACGNPNNVEMHHIEHVRKGLFRLINPQDTVKRMQFIRNRRQVPLCSSCHDKVHNGTYSGQPLKTLFRKQKNFDNRIAAPEGYIIKGEPYEGLPLEESLIEKGWIEIKSPNIHYD